MDISAVGSRIERELGRIAEDSLLGKWMAHRIAELMQRAESATGEAKSTADAEIEALILELWKMRRELPGQVDPDKRLERAVRVLEQLDRDRSTFSEPIRGAVPILNAAASAYSQMASLNLQLTVLTIAEDYERLDKEENKLPLSEESIAFRKEIDAKLHEFVQGRIFFRSPGDKKPTSSNASMLREKLRGSLDQAMKSLATVRDHFNQTPAKSSRKVRASSASASRREPVYKKI